MLSDLVCVWIVCALVVDHECICGVFDFGISKVTCSHYFKVLREVGLMYMRSEGIYWYFLLWCEDVDVCFLGLLDVVLTVVECEVAVFV